MSTLSDPLVALMDLPGVKEACADARTAVDSLLWDRSLKSRHSEIQGESIVRGAWSNAWFEGAETSLSTLRSGAAFDDSPVGRVLAGSLAMHMELPQFVEIVGVAPAQVFARMHALAAHGFVPDDKLGRPRTNDQGDDPLHLGVMPEPEVLLERLRALGGFLSTSTAPGVLVAAIAHAELAAIRPFDWGSGLVARGAVRVVLAQRGVDPTMLSAPELGLRAVGRPAYVRAVRGYVAGTPEGVANMIRLVSQAIQIGAEQPSKWFE